MDKAIIVNLERLNGVIEEWFAAHGVDLEKIKQLELSVSNEGLDGIGNIPAGRMPALQKILNDAGIIAQSEQNDALNIIGVPDAQAYKNAILYLERDIARIENISMGTYHGRSIGGSIGTFLEGLPDEEKLDAMAAISQRIGLSEKMRDALVRSIKTMAESTRSGGRG